MVVRRTRTSNARQIVDQGADYVLAVKDHQPKSCEAIRDFFIEHLEDDLKQVSHRHHQTHEKGHGPIDDRYYYLAKPPSDFPLARDLPNLKAIGMTVQVTEHDDCRASDDVRYYITSRYTSGQRFADAVRGPWGIENSLHRQLDVTYQEDQCPVRIGHADANFSLLRQTSLSLLKNHKTEEVGVKNKRLCAAWNDDYRLQVLTGI